MSIRVLRPRRSVLVRIALAAVLSLFGVSSAHAACTLPTADAGSQFYNTSYNVMQYCNGTAWVNMGAAGGAATGFGTMVSGNFCTTDGTLVNCNTSAINLSGAQATGTMAAARMPALSGDVTSSAGAVATVVGKIQGVAVSATTPTNGQALVYNSTNTQWEPTAIATNAISQVDSNVTVTDAGVGTIVIAVDGSTRVTYAAGSITSTVPALLSNGAVGAPAFSFSGDPNTGLYNVGADDIGIATNGVLRVDVSTTNVTSTLPFLAPNGAVGAPAFSFSGDTNTGIYSTGTADQFAIATNGTERVRVDATGAVSIGSAAAANASSILDLTSTAKGFLPPRMSGAQRDAIASPAAGLTIFNTNTNRLETYSGGAWTQNTNNGNTVIATWPDSIYCSGSAGFTVMTHTYGNGTNRNYVGTNGNGATAVMYFNSTTGAYAGVTDVSWGSTYYTDCINQSLTQLYAAGKAFNYVGAGTASTGGGSPGYVQFNNGGNVAGDSNLFWDNTNKRLGIGTASPGSALHVRGSIQVDSASSGFVKMSGATDTGATRTGFIEWYGANTTRYGYFGNDTGKLTLNLENSASFNVAGGNVGIGTTTPSTALHVAFDAPNTTLTGTTAYGGIHLQQSTTNDEFVGITTTGSNGSGGTMGGILFQGSGSYGTKLHFLTTSSYAAGMQNRMTIDHLGNVGIGTASPSTKLHVYSATNNNVTFDSGSGINYLTLKSNNGGGNYGSTINFNDGATANAYLISTADSTFRIGTAGSDRLSISAGGNVVIGTSTYAGKLRVYTAASEPAIYAQNTGGGNYSIYGEANGNYGIYGRTLSAAHGGVLGYDAQGTYYGILGYNNAWSFYGNGSTYIGGTYQGSDARLKENIEPLKGGLDTISKLRPVSFTWKKDTEQFRSQKADKQLGLIAQEVQKVMPEIVTTVQAARPMGDKQPETLNQKLGTFYGVDYTKIIPVLIEATQELKAANDNLAEANRALRHDVDELRAQLINLKRATPAQ